MIMFTTFSPCRRSISSRRHDISSQRNKRQPQIARRTRIVSGFLSCRLIREIRVNPRLRLCSPPIYTGVHSFYGHCAQSPSPSPLRAAPPGSRFKFVTTPTETCPICRGTGWQTIERGKEREAVRCECRVRDRGERLLDAAHIPPRYAGCDLTNFNTEGERETLLDAKRTAEQFAENYPLEKRGLLFVGSPGVGKTHLAVSILRRLMGEKGIQCRFVDYRELLKQIQYTYNPTVQMTELELLQPVFETEVVLLDELGAIRTSQWVWDTVAHILNNRYAENRTTLITTNFEDRAERALEEKERGEHFTDPERAVRGETLGDRIGGAMWSRLHEMCQKVDMVGGDYRRRFYSTRLVRKRMSVKSHKDELPPAVEEN